MVRTPLVFLGVPVGIYLVFNKHWLHSMLMVVIIAGIFVPWILRNYRVYHSFIPTNAASGVNLIVGNHLGASGEQEPYELNNRLIKDFGYIRANEEAQRIAINFIKENPLEYVSLVARRVSIYFSFARPTGFWFHLSGVSKIITLVLSSVYSILLFTFGFFGVAKIKKLPAERRTKVWYLLAMLVMMPLAIVGIIVETRYRFLSYPFFALFAGYGISQLRKKDTCWACFAVVFFLLFANSSFDIIRSFGRIIEKWQGL